MPCSICVSAIHVEHSSVVPLALSFPVCPARLAPCIREREGDVSTKAWLRPLYTYMYMLYKHIDTHVCTYHAFVPML